MYDLLLGVIAFYKQILVETKQQLRLVTKWLVIGAVIGGLVFLFNPGLLESILKLFEDRFGPDPSLNFDLAMGIFVNNLQASAIALFGGLILGLGPFFVVITNGFILGFILVSIFAVPINDLAQSFTIVLTGLLPHGILEIPAFLLAGALGLKLGIDWLRKENKGQRFKTLWQNIKYVFIKGIPAVVLLLFIAALIEVYISGYLLEKIFN